MKIQNTEMEFVTFDAQDVIATSGGPLTAKFTVSESLYTGDYTDYIVNEYSIFWEYGSSTQASLMVGGVGGYFNGKTFVMTENETRYMLDGNDLGIVGVTEGTTANQTLRSLNEISNWLKAHGVIQ